MSFKNGGPMMHHFAQLMVTNNQADMRVLVISNTLDIINIRDKYSTVCCTTYNHFTAISLINPNVFIAPKH